MAFRGFPTSAIYMKWIDFCWKQNHRYYNFFTWAHIHNQNKWQILVRNYWISRYLFFPFQVHEPSLKSVPKIWGKNSGYAIEPQFQFGMPGTHLPAEASSCTRAGTGVSHDRKEKEKLGGTFLEPRAVWSTDRVYRPRLETEKLCKEWGKRECRPAEAAGVGDGKRVFLFVLFFSFCSLSSYSSMDEN